jgi:membrane protein implicated in regulation of membrane protease activity
MCHVLLLMPVIALPVFWLTPLSFAIPFYLIIMVISILLYRAIAKSMRQPLETGALRLIGSEADVVSRLSPGHSAQYVVRSGGEMWTARCADVLQPRETVSIAAIRGIGLVVERRNNGSNTEQLSDVETKVARAKAAERHCH